MLGAPFKPAFGLEWDNSTQRPVSLGPLRRSYGSGSLLWRGRFHQADEHGGELRKIQIHLRVHLLHVGVGLKGRGPGEGVAVAWTVAYVDIHVEKALRGDDGRVQQ